MRFENIAFLLLSLAFYGAQSAAAQDLDFQISNQSLEQIVASQQQNTAQIQAEVSALTAPISTSVILQADSGNIATSSITQSNGGVAALLQSGENNRSSATVQNSPDSNIAGVQLGNDNILDLAIVGGYDNVLAASQIGTANELGIALVDSVGTTITYGQIGQGVRGSVTFVNAPAGTNISLGGGF
jgi:hypothetical protein